MNWKFRIAIVSIITKILMIILLLSGIILPVQSQNRVPVLLEAGFQNPPESAKVWTWWHWMNGNISREGITADLEAMKRVGIGGVYNFHVGEMLPFNGSVDFMSPTWWELSKFASHEASRLNLQFGFHNCPGWNVSGGPDVKVELSMQKLVWSETTITGLGECRRSLPRPPVDTIYNYYNDIVVLAFPDLKYGNVAKNSILNISNAMDSSGQLVWDTPPGNWKVMRFGHTTTGKKNYPAPLGGEGLECDKMSKVAVEAFFKSYPAKYLANTGKIKNGIKHIEIDSYEAGDQNWTPGFRKEFIKRRGYDPLIWLPVLAKRTVECRSLSERFTYDMNQTIAELFDENYYGHFARLVHQYPGLLLTIEPYEGPFNTFDVAARADVLMGEFWQKPADWGWGWTKNVIAAAHFLGKNIVSAEALTGWPHKSKWENDPFTLKASADKAFALGVNRLVLHTIAHQPWADNVRPGMTMSFWGTHFGRTQTWWEQSKGWFDYLSRCQFLLQKGEFVSDILYLNKGFTEPVEGYRADICSESQLLNMAEVRDNRIVLPHGKTYRLLAFSDTLFTPEVARRLKKLADAGIQILGKRFNASPSLQNYPECDKEVKAISDDLWDRGKIEDKPLKELLVEKSIYPDFSSSDKSVMWVHRKLSEGDIYFISNQLDSTRIVDCTFRVSGKQPELWDAATGKISEVNCYEIKNGFTRLPLKFDPSGSAFILFRNNTEQTRGVSLINWPVYKTLQELSRVWTVHFDPNWGGPQNVSFQYLSDWSKSDNHGIKYYSGTAVYETQFELKDVPSSLLIDLGKVKTLAEVTLNGHPLGVLWKFPFIIDISKAAKAGINDLKVNVTNLWANRLIGDEQEPADVKWRERETQVPLHIETGGRMLMELPAWLVEGKQRPSSGRFTFTTWNYFQKDSPLLESGLLGPVQLVTLQKTE